LSISKPIIILHVTKKRHIKLHKKLQVAQLVRNNLTMCHMLSFQLITKWTCQISSFCMRPRMKRLNMSLHFNNMTMKMIRMMKIVNSGPKARKAHLLWLSNLIGHSWKIQVTQVLSTMKPIGMYTPQTNKLHTKIQVWSFVWIHKHWMNICHNESQVNNVQKQTLKINGIWFDVDL
jgi:hypothetical protein